ncbi:MFS transporter [Lentibacter sp. XHP0401]|jgi:MFS transporter, UMF1 family|uniref:MFS transporter n=1 Tax=Lentibacter sp. XHP0401 TaxID=2984334 RepID=UPI0021E8DF84|nr:MFS transporter [Lentibacter sp. XHP0401]MCV2893535.1 MFS transporter [Lentibacter sp. XHP0401]
MTTGKVISARKRIWGWYFFDWASQPYHTLLVTFIFGPFFASVAAQHFLGTGMSEQAADAQAQSMWSFGLGIIGLFIGLGAPFLGALADSSGRRVPWVFAFSVLYVIGAFGLWYMLPDGSNLWWGLVAFGIGFIGAEWALIFINSQLPSLVSDKGTGEISGSGFAFGYIGGLVALAIMLLLFVEQSNGKTLIGLDPAFGFDAEAREGTRFVGPLTAIWFAVFMIPYFLWVRDAPVAGKSRASVSAALASLGRSLRGLKHNTSLAAYLGSSMFYRDALNGLYSFGGVYAALVLNWEVTQIGVFGIIGALSAALFSWLGGKFDRRFGPKPVIITAIWLLIGVCVIIVSMSREMFFGLPLAEGSNMPDIIFLICGVFIGGLGGTLQAASRTLMVRHAKPEAPTESFGLYGLTGRATAFLAPTLIGLATMLSGSARLGVSPVIGLFLIGLILLRWVKPEGDRS